jgi:hypothetical protein
MKKETKIKIRIAEAATERYIKNPRFTIQSLAEMLEMKPSEIFDLFPNRSSILLFYYESHMIKYEEEISKIDDYQSFSLHEKLSTLALSLLDQFMEHREFVDLTYGPMICRPATNTAFEQHFKRAVQSVNQNDNRVSSSAGMVTGNWFPSVVFLEFHGLIHFWLQDESNNYENSMALVDKWAALTEELFYTKIVDKGFDLAKFLLYNSPLRDLAERASTFRKNYL